MDAFDPAQWNFLKLKNFEYPKEVSVYEYRNHPTVDGTPNFMRLNLYLSKDENYVTIWYGLIESMITEAKLKSVEKPSNFDFHDMYTEELFRGYLDAQETAGHILRALRIDRSKQYSQPQILSAGTKNRLKCNWVDAV